MTGPDRSIKLAGDDPPLGPNAGRPAMYCAVGALLNNGPPGTPDPQRVDPGGSHRGRNVNSPKRNETLPSTRHNERDRLPIISACARSTISSTFTAADVAGVAAVAQLHDPGADL